MTRVAVTGAGGRLGRALVAALAARGHEVAAWSRPDYDLDDPSAASRMVHRDPPAVVAHAAAWTDVDACTREPALAERRNAEATGELARVCAARGVSLLVVSTNEVFDGRLAHGAYRPSDATAPINTYGRSKLRGEVLAAEAFEAGVARATLAIARTSWLFGPPGNDFPEKIIRAALRARDDRTTLRLVADEIGSPSYTLDVADGIAQLVDARRVDGLHHIVNDGEVSRADWAEALLEDAGIVVDIERVAAATWTRASTPPLRAPLLPTPLPEFALRSWRDATRAYVPSIHARPIRSAPIV